jgi:chitinase
MEFSENSRLLKDQLRNRYVEAEQVIRDNLQRLVALSNSPQSGRLRAKFLEESEQLTESLTEMVDELGGDILQYARESTQCHSRRIGEKMKQVKELINTGLYVQGVLVTMRNIVLENQAFRDHFEDAYKAAEKRIDNQMRQCQSVDDISGELSDQLVQNRALTDEKLADNLLKYLEDKYHEKSWLVIVYSDGDLDHHALSKGFAVGKSDEAGKSAAALAIDKKTKFNVKVRDVLTGFDVDARQYDSEEVFDDLKSSIEKITSVDGTNNGLAVIERSTNVASAWSTRLDPYIQKYDAVSVMGVFYVPNVSNEPASPKSQSGQFGGSRRFTVKKPLTKISQDDVVDDSCASGCGSPPPCGKKLVAYMSSWSDSLLTVQQASRLTHIIFAFIEMKPDGSLVVGSADPAHSTDPDGDFLKASNRLNRLAAVKQEVPGLKTLFAVGGWENSQYFSDAVASESMQSNFISDMRSIIVQYGFDGIDIDWEYPVTGGATNGTLDDRDNYVAFLRRIRSTLQDLQSQENRTDDYLVTIASAAGSWVLEVGYDLDNITDVVDWINVMTYDYYGAWDSKWGAYTGPVSPLYYGTPKGFSGKMNADFTLKYYSCRTSKPEKILMGLPFYGRYWYNVGDALDQSDPLWRLADPNEEGNFDGGFAGWNEVQSDWLQRPGFQKLYHARTATPYLWNAGNRTLLAYENVQSLAEKMKYANSHGLGGVMFWAIDLDDDQGTLLNSITNGNPICSATQQLQYRCNPLRDRRWWTFEDDPNKAGMCGKSAPLFNGFYPLCDPDDPGYACCGVWGYCGDGDACTCPTCVDYGKNPEKLLDQPVKPSGPVRWHTLDADIPPGQPRCGSGAPKLANGDTAICNPDDPGYHCCSGAGYCGTGWQYCSCDSCKDFKQNPGYSYPTKTWWDWADGSDKGGRCGPTAPKIDVNGQSIYPTCNHGSNGAYCCSKWGNCGSGAGFCDCDDCVDFKQNPFFRWPTK